MINDSSIDVADGRVRRMPKPDEQNETKRSINLLISKKNKKNKIMSKWRLCTWMGGNVDANNGTDRIETMRKKTVIDNRNVYLGMAPDIRCAWHTFVRLNRNQWEPKEKSISSIQWCNGIIFYYYFPCHSFDRCCLPRLQMFSTSIRFFVLQSPDVAGCSYNHKAGPYMHAHGHTETHIYCLFFCIHDLLFISIHCVLSCFFVLLSALFVTTVNVTTAISDKISGKLISSFHCDNKCHLPHDVETSAFAFGLWTTASSVFITSKGKW